MFVLIDMEWLTNEENRFSPTQISAIKTDENWNELERFSSFIRPVNSKFHNWGHISYTGGKAIEFQRSDNFDAVFKKLHKFFCKEDTIIFWHESSEKIFRKIIKKVFNTDVINTVICINKYVYAFLEPEKSSGGNMYKIAEQKGIDISCRKPHYSLDDVEVLHELMQNIGCPAGKMQAYLKDLAYSFTALPLIIICGRSSVFNSKQCVAWVLLGIVRSVGK